MTEQRWGDPDALFPFCMTEEAYRNLMTEAGTYGLSNGQLGGVACVRCGAGLDTADRVKVGEKEIVWRARNGHSERVEHVLYVCPSCDHAVLCPWWCERAHLPMIRGSRWLDFAIHETAAIATVVGVNGTEPHDLSLTIAQHEDDDEVRPPHIYLCGTDITTSAAQARQLAAALLNAADKLDEITGATQ